MTATLIEIGELDRTRPAVDASSVVVADWYEQKAALLHHIAADSASASERDTCERWADCAHAHAVRLLAALGGPTPDILHHAHAVRQARRNGGDS